MPKYLFFLFLLLGLSSHSQDISNRYSEKISPDSIKRYLYTLASDSMQGRETGKKGQKLAAEFLASKYYNWQLEGKGLNSKHTHDTTFQDSFFQDHTISIKSNRGRNLAVNGEYYLYGKDFIYSSPEKDTTIFINNLLFAGSINNKNIKNIIQSDRYYNIDLLIYDREDQTDDFLRTILEMPGKIKSVFLITDDEKIKKIFIDGISPGLKSPRFVFYITEAIAKKIFPPNKFEKTNRKVNRRSRPVVTEVACEMSAGMVADDSELRGQNVIAFIPGSEFTKETIVVSSHYDHLGYKDSLIFHGADDNASGTSAVLEMARVFKIAQKEGNGPKRNMLFLNVSGEEKGLLGSTWFVANPTIPLGHIVANLNIDMVGRTDSIHDSTGVRNYIYVIGSNRLSTQLHNINEEQNKMHGLLELDYKYNSVDDPNNFYRRSDHYNFAKKGIPVIFYFDGKHADYHMPSDTADKIDFELLSKRAKLVFLTAWELANRKERIVVDVK